MINVQEFNFAYFFGCANLSVEEYVLLQAIWNTNRQTHFIQWFSDFTEWKAR